MAKTRTYGCPADLEADYTRALALIRAPRPPGKLAWLTRLAAVLLALVGATYAMYASTAPTQ